MSIRRFDRSGSRSPQETRNDSPFSPRPFAPPRAAAPLSPEAIQRKVGFEFETNMPIRANQEQIIAKNTTLYQAASGDWKITPDSSNMEFSTEPFEEEGDNPELERMQTAVGEMAEAFDSVHLNARFAQIEQEDTPLADAITVGRHFPFHGHPVYVPHDMRVLPATAKPQVTGGVRLENIPALLAASSSTELPLESPTNPEDVAFFGEDPIARKRGQKRPVGGSDFTRDSGILVRSEMLASNYVSGLKHRGVEGWDKLEGMLALIYSYLLAGDRQEHVQDQAKYFVPLMSRMSFAGMYSTLPREAREAFDPEAILDNARLDPSEPLYKQGYLDPKDKQNGMVAQKGPVRKKWLESIERGRDLMSLEGKTSVTRGMFASSPAMGEHQALDPDHQGNFEQLVQIELRRLPGTVPPEEWEPLATTLFQMFQRVQRGRRQD
jgi:hypothetical protein